MTTFEHGKAPAWAYVTWDMSRDKRGNYQWNLSDGTCFVCVAYCSESADAICRALSIANLTEDWAAANRHIDALELDIHDPFCEIPSSKAASKAVDDARKALLKACAE